MNSLIHIFNNREYAIGIWIFGFCVLAFSKKNIRESIFHIFKFLLNKKILSVFSIMLLYSLFILYILYILKLWYLENIKDTIYWFAGTATILLFKANNAIENEHFFKEIVIDNLKLICFVEFLINFYVFNIWIELCLIPALTFIILLKAFGETDPKNRIVVKALDYVIGIIGLWLLSYVVFKATQELDKVFTYSNFQSIVFPILLTFLYLPFVYFLALYMKYEMVFIRLEIFNRVNNKDLKIARRKIFFNFLFDLHGLHKWSNNKINLHINSIEDLKDSLLHSKLENKKVR